MYQGFLQINRKKPKDTNWLFKGNEMWVANKHEKILSFSNYQTTANRNPTEMQFHTHRTDNKAAQCVSNDLEKQDLSRTAHGSIFSITSIKSNPQYLVSL